MIGTVEILAIPASEGIVSEELMNVGIFEALTRGSDG